MKSLLFSLISFFTVNAMAGSPGHTALFCESASGKTNVTVVERFDSGSDSENVTIVFSITGKSIVYDAKSMGETEDEKQQIRISNQDGQTTYGVYWADNADFELEVGALGARIKPGFYHPRDLKTANFAIDLKCKYAEEQI